MVYKMQEIKARKSDITVERTESLWKNSNRSVLQQIAWSSFHQIRELW